MRGPLTHKAEMKEKLERCAYHLLCKVSFV
jgi:hypothetical protein